MKHLFRILLVAAVTYGAWPYYGLWRLSQATASGDPQALAEWVDLAAVRADIIRRLNKDLAGPEVGISNEFIAWLQDGIRRLGKDAVDRLVTLDWVRQRLLAHSPEGARNGFLGQVTYAFFEGPARFLVRIGDLGEQPVHLRLRLEGSGWRLVALYD